MTDDRAHENEIRSDVPHSARIWNYWLGGKDNYPVDREAGDRIRERNPHIAAIARQDRAFLGRVVRYLAGECGIRQFLDIGTGLPTVDNTHEVAQRVAPESRIVYVDNDPLVLAHARALLTSSEQGACQYIDADLRDPAAILREAEKTLDLTRPVAILLLSVVHHLSDQDDPESIIQALMAGVPAGSHLAIAHGTSVINKEITESGVAHFNARFGRPPVQLRHPDRIGGFFAGLELVEPGLVSVSRWRPAHPDPDEVDQFGAVARKPRKSRKP